MDINEEIELQDLNYLIKDLRIKIKFLENFTLKAVNNWSMCQVSKDDIENFKNKECNEN
tara:strand:- start:179 stop:355 length:177 start_codon:yes stop_codon:yes gene_type:complete